MPYRDEAYDLKVQIHSQDYDLTPRDREQIEADLESLRRVVVNFPVADLHIHIRQHPRSQDFHVKASLRLPKRILFTGERDPLLLVASERCVRKLVNKVKAFKEKLGSKAAHEKRAEGTLHDVIPDREPDIKVLEEAARDRDFVPFRQAMSVYDGTLSKRVGRWIERYPDVAARLGEEFLISDIVEEIYLNAMERFADRPADRIGNWLDHLIDPSLRAFLTDAEAEKQNLELLRELEPPVE